MNYTQKHYYGSVVSCIAFILRQDYDEVLKLFKQPWKVWYSGFSYYDILIALSNANMDSNCVIKSNESSVVKLKDKDLIFFENLEKYPNGHWVVKHEEKFFDPWINHPLMDVANGFCEKIEGNIISIIRKKLC